MGESIAHGLDPVELVGEPWPIRKANPLRISKHCTLCRYSLVGSSKFAHVRWCMRQRRSATVGNFDATTTCHAFFKGDELVRCALRLVVDNYAGSILIGWPTLPASVRVAANEYTLNRDGTMWLAVGQGDHSFTHRVRMASGEDHYVIVIARSAVEHYVSGARRFPAARIMEMPGAKDQHSLQTGLVRELIRLVRRDFELMDSLVPAVKADVLRECGAEPSSDRVEEVLNVIQIGAVDDMLSIVCHDAPLSVEGLVTRTEWMKMLAAVRVLAVDAFTRKRISALAQERQCAVELLVREFSQRRKT